MKSRRYRVQCYFCGTELPYPTLRCPECDSWLVNPSEQEEGLPEDPENIEKYMRGMI